MASSKDARFEAPLKVPRGGVGPGLDPLHSPDSRTFLDRNLWRILIGYMNIVSLRVAKLARTKHKNYAKTVNYIVAYL